MFKKGSKLFSILNMKCPRCQEEKLFKGPITEGIYNMHDRCPNCDQAFHLEPGFYWGAMYIGYGLSSGYMLVTVLSFIFILGLSVNASFLAALFLGIFIVPYIARLSRSIWISLYVSYNAKYKKEKEHSLEQAEHQK